MPSSIFNSAIFLTLRSPLYPVIPEAPRCGLPSAPTTRASLSVGSGSGQRQGRHGLRTARLSGPRRPQVLGAGHGSACAAHPLRERRPGPPEPPTPPKAGQRGGPVIRPRPLRRGEGRKAGRGRGERAEAGLGGAGRRPAAQGSGAPFWAAAGRRAPGPAPPRPAPALGRPESRPPALRCRTCSNFLGRAGPRRCRRCLRARLAGVVFLGVGLWAWSEKGVLSDLTKVTRMHGIDPVVLVLMVGVVMFTLGFAGCVGALRENICLLNFLLQASPRIRQWPGGGCPLHSAAPRKFCSAIVLIFFLELAVAVLAFLFQDWVRDRFREFFESNIRSYRDDIDLQNLIDSLQKANQCCGAYGPEDWDLNVYFNCSGASYSREKCGVPFSCCVPGPRAKSCEYTVWL
ncbi:tetraspanin-14 isoform X1 [Camelus ferus]|uniref:Tetraspanin-14 isoform X1 n=1 Tax=Camelus ferus TaxID=419612 RepID=A0A8B8TYY8_CAMFR|nr:tetraspanin-14 isoform X1 [Camelus ferus]